MNALVIDIPTSAPGVASGDRARLNFYQEATSKIRQLPGVEGAATGSFVPWRDAGIWGPPMSFAAEGYTPANGEENPRARFRIASPGYFAVLGVSLIAGRDFTDDDRGGHEPVAIVSQSLAQRLFPNGDAVNRHMWWTNSVSLHPTQRRIVGIVGDVDDESVVSGTAMSVYQPVEQVGVGGRLFVRTAGDPHAVVPAVERVIRELAADQPVERAATLQDVRAEILSSDRVSAFVFLGFAGMALLIAVVGVAGVLAFSVSARTREFGVRLAVGSAPRQILGRVFLEGVAIAGIGIAVGAAGGYVLARAAAKVFATAQMPGALPPAVAAGAIIAAASIASLLPAARASRVDVLQALRSE
jgi:ABC-type antimicrobial peptide transport system permease subunit